MAALAFSTDVCAQNLPGSADISRIPTTPKSTIPNSAPDKKNLVPSFSSFSKIPEGADQIHLNLKDIHVEGATAFTQEQISLTYAPYVGKDITLDIVYNIAAKITSLYRNSGYFLSVAYVPDQQIKDGIVHIKVIEGYVAYVESEDQKLLSSFVIQSYVNDLLKHKPLKSETMESFLLRINDLPGYTFRAVLAPTHSEQDGAVKLTLIPSQKDSRGVLSFDNFSSRFLGPNQISAFYEDSFIPLQQTNISGVTGLPTEKLKSLSLGHSIVFAPDLKFNVNANVTDSKPGYTLEALDVKSKSNYLGAGLEWQYIRQRMENLSFSMMLESHNTSIDFLNTAFTRDHVRVLRAKANYDGDWGGEGYNWVGFTLSHGLSGLGSSKQGDDNLSREEAKPDFTKAEITVSRYQKLPKEFGLVLSIAGQLASGPLYSSEEFGYGGQSFGRAYDSSEITGDRGISGSLEFQYDGLNTGKNFKISPYGFYDIGAVWNYDEGQPKRQSGATAGFGTRIAIPMDISFNFGLAFPLTRRIETPIYGTSKEGPRIFLQLSKNF